MQKCGILCCLLFRFFCDRKKRNLSLLLLSRPHFIFHNPHSNQPFAPSLLLRLVRNLQPTAKRSCWQQPHARLLALPVLALSHLCSSAQCAWHTPPLTQTRSRTTPASTSTKRIPMGRTTTTHFLVSLLLPATRLLSQCKHPPMHEPNLTQFCFLSSFSFFPLMCFAAVQWCSRVVRACLCGTWMASATLTSSAHTLP